MCLQERARGGLMLHEWSPTVCFPLCALLVCVAILQITNARSHFSPGEVTNFFRHQPETPWQLTIFQLAPVQRCKHQYGGISSLAADQSVTGSPVPLGRRRP
jgi:hypothetical protein